ncbi:MAG: hypothetical protein IJZ16_01245 [Clostridia bacterium]|nr:hypothetical protein [Clostridia bacterium]
MIKKIIDGICLALSSNFGDEREIYTEAVEQGLKEGSFAIVCLNPTNSRFLGERYLRTNQFCIHYFPKSNEPNSECLEILEDLYETLELIEVDSDLVRGTKMSSEIDEGVLHFFVNYDFFTISETDKTLMEDFEQTFDVKG